MKLPIFNPNEPVGSNFEEGFQEQVRRSLPQAFLSPLYAIGPAASRALFHDGISATLIDLAARNFLNFTDNGPDLSPDEIKERFGFNSKVPLSNSAAQYVSQRNKELAEIDTKFQSIEPGFLTDATILATSIGAGFLDPANLLLFGAVSSVLKNVGTSVLRGSQFIRSSVVGSRISSFLLEDTLSSTIVRGATSGFVENAIQAPFQIERAEEFDREFSLTENLVSGTIFGATFGALHYGVNRFTGKLNTPKVTDPEIISKVRRHSDTPTQQGATSLINKEAGLSEGLITAGKAAVVLNKRPEVVPFKQLESRLNTPTTIKDSTFTYTFTPLKVEDAKLTTFFNPHATQGSNIGIDTQSKFREHFGRGILLTDSEDFATSLSNSGTLLVVDVQENIKLFNTSDGLDLEIKGKLLDIFSEYIPREEALTFIDNPTKNIIDEANIIASIEGNTEINERINKTFKDLGFAGFLFEGTTSEGPHNGLFLFDGDSFKVREIRFPEVTRIPDEFTKAEVEGYRQALLDSRNDIDYDPEYDVMSNIDLDDNFESIFITTKIKQEMANIAQNMTDLNIISGIGGNLTADDVLEEASIKVLKGYRGKSALIEEVQKAMKEEIGSLSDIFGVPKGLIDQRKLIMAVKEKLLKVNPGERPDIEVKFLETLSDEITKATEVFNLPVESLNQEQVIMVARHEVMKSLDLDTGFDKMREATKALITCMR